MIIFADIVKFSSSPFPFCNPVEVFTCDISGKTIEMGDVSLTVPPGAIPAEITVHIEMGVMVSGPFVFPCSYQPVSPIISLCFQECVDLLLPVTIKLPHIINDVDKVKLLFAKASHHKKGKIHFFEHLVDGESYFTNSVEDCGNGILCVQHFCFYSIIAKMDPELAKRKGYCLYTFTKEITPSNYEIIHVCTFFLRIFNKVSPCS